MLKSHSNQCVFRRISVLKKKKKRERGRKEGRREKTLYFPYNGNWILLLSLSFDFSEINLGIIKDEVLIRTIHNSLK